MTPLLQHFGVTGFRSLRQAEVELGAMNVLVGANGSGKSNLILALRLLRAWAAGGAEAFVTTNGGPDALLHGGHRLSPELALSMTTAGGFSGTLRARAEGSRGLRFSTEPAEWPEDVRHALADIHIFHFKDLLPRRKAVLEAPLAQDTRLRTGGDNLGPCLRWLHDQQPGAYRRLVETIRLVAPFFDDFQFEERGPNLRLRWREAGLDLVHGPEALSDGTIRFIGLATLLLQPADRLPPLILLDEPELGLHPWAVQILAELIAGAAAHTQVLLSTQSVTLLNAFRLEDAIIVERNGSGSVLRRPDPATLAAWSDESSLGELWERNLLGGTP